MSLENEYFSLKIEKEQEMKKFNKFWNLDVTNMTEEQINARERGIKNTSKTIDEIDDLLEEIKNELYDYIYNDGEISTKTIEELIVDLSNDIFFRNNKEDYDGEVLVEKRNFLMTLI